MPAMWALMKEVKMPAAQELAGDAAADDDEEGRLAAMMRSAHLHAAMPLSTIFQRA